MKTLPARLPPYQYHNLRSTLWFEERETLKSTCLYQTTKRLWRRAEIWSKVYKASLGLLQDTGLVSQSCVSVILWPSGLADKIAAHAKGILLRGSFTPTDAAKTLSSAPHFSNHSTPVTARFSSSTGIPQIPDTDPNGNPRGFALRFHISETPRRVHTDIIAHSTPFFPARTGEGFGQFLKAIKTDTVADFLASHPETLAFVQAPKPTPNSFGKENYFGVNAFKFVSEHGKETFVRYRIVPEAGENHLDEAALKDKSPNFLYDEMQELVKKGSVRFRLLAQIAEKGDATNDATIYWPEERKLVELGIIKLDELVDNDSEEQRKIIFDPIPRVGGIEPSDDPLLDVRAGVYLISGRERRAANDASKRV
jgi:catalase